MSILNLEPDCLLSHVRSEFGTGSPGAMTTRDYPQSHESTYASTSHFPVSGTHSREPLPSPPLLDASQPPDRQLGHRRREHRPQYYEEEEYFIWYHRVDLAHDWQDIVNAFNAQFTNRTRQGIQSLQCKYYRCVAKYGVPSVRIQGKGRDARERFREQFKKRYALRTRLPTVRYPWMRTLSLDVCY